MADIAKWLIVGACAVTCAASWYWAEYYGNGFPVAILASVGFRGALIAKVSGKW